MKTKYRHNSRKNKGKKHRLLTKETSWKAGFYEAKHEAKHEVKQGSRKDKLPHEQPFNLNLQ